MPSHTISGNLASTPTGNETFIDSRNRSCSSTDFLLLYGRDTGLENRQVSDASESSVDELVLFRGTPDRIRYPEADIKTSAHIVYAPKPISSPLNPILNTRGIEEHEQYRNSVIHSNPVRSAAAQHQVPPTTNIATSYISSSIQNRENDNDSQISDRSQLSRSISPSKRFSSPRQFLLPRTSGRTDVRSASVDNSSHYLEARRVLLEYPARPFTPTPLSPENTQCLRSPSPRQMARRRRRCPGSPRPDCGTPNLRRSVLTPTAVEEGKLWKVFNEDEESPSTPESPGRTLSPNTPRPRPSSPPAAPCYYTFSRLVNHPYKPSLNVGSVPHQPGTPYNYPSIRIAHPILEICDRLLYVFNDSDKYEHFLSHQDDTAQYLLDLLQKLLDHFRLGERYKTKFFKALLRLSRKSGLVPDGLFLTNVVVESEGPIADGHFGEIYKGLFRNKLVCLKVVKIYQKSDQHVLLKAFSREAVLWNQLSHNNVLPFIGIYRIGDKRDRIGLVSPWMEYGDINEYLEKYPRAERRLLVSDIAAGILYLHTNGVVHGDLKGGNILVTASHRACLADFGLSSVQDSQGLKMPSLSSGDPQGGTARFQAPELNDPIVARPKSRASDIYAFGLVCYEIFTGNYPFPDIPLHWAVIMKVAKGERPLRPLGSLYDDRGLTDRMWALMEECWAHDPMDRPTAAEIVNNRLLPQLDQRPPGGWGDRFSSFRALDGEGRSGTQAFSAEEALRRLETIGISSVEL